MRILLDVHCGAPVYRQIVDQVRFLIASGALSPGSALPSTRSLGQALGINPMTVSKAFGLLEAEGLVEHRPGLPLAVRPIGHDTMASTREAELRTRLEPGVRAAKQLGFSADDAVRVFHELLTNDPAPEPTS